MNNLSPTSHLRVKFPGHGNIHGQLIRDRDAVRKRPSRVGLRTDSNFVHVNALFRQVPLGGNALPSLRQ
jgi:hypothetical protein